MKKLNKPIKKSKRTFGAFVAHSMAAGQCICHCIHVHQVDASPEMSKR